MLAAQGRLSSVDEVAASACHSFWEEIGTEAGAEGLRLSAGLAQQAGVEQCRISQPLQQQLGIVLLEFAIAAPVAVGTLSQSRANPRRMATATFTGRAIMVSNRSF